MKSEKVGRELVALEEDTGEGQTRSWTMTREQLTKHRRDPELDAKLPAELRAELDAPRDVPAE